jgi:hypothetical protein
MASPNTRDRRARERSIISNVALVGENGEPLNLNRRQAARVERELNGTLTYAKLGELLPKLMAPMLGRFASAAQDTDVTQLALIELLVEKGIITEEELGFKRGKVLARLGLIPAPPAEGEEAAPAPAAEARPESGIILLGDPT